jgi:hypothetical protein
VKRILPRLLDDNLVVQMFIEEARIAAAADHDNIAKVFELGKTEDGRYFIVMEHLSGIDLELLLRGAAQRSLQVPIWFTVQLVCDVLEALSFVHSLADDEGRPRNVIHRDVTPSNIFVTFMGRAKLSDFGIADFAGKTPTTVAGQLKGKLAYMSPEQLNARLLDQRSDLFTVGVVLWEALTQQRLFGQLNEVQAMLAICDGERKPPSDLRHDIPFKLDAIALKALAAERERRYQSAAEFQSALLDFLHEIRGPVRQSDMKHVVQVLLGREEPDEETMGGPVAEARDPNASFLLRLDKSERRILAEAAEAALKARREESSDLEETFVRGVRAAELEEDETLTMGSFEEHDFWVKTPNAPAAGPMKYQAAHGRLVEAGAEGAPIAISADQRQWMDLARFCQLSGQDLMTDAMVSGQSITLVGSLEQRSVAAVFGLISRDGPTGTLSIANVESEQWYEIYVSGGQPVGVLTNVPSMQMPALLVAKNRMKASEIERWLHTVVKTGQSGGAMDRETFMRERLTELFRWEKAEYTFQVEALPRPGNAFAPSLLALLPGLVEAACSIEVLRARLEKKLEKGLEPSWRFADAVAEMALPAADRTIVERLKSKKPIAKLLAEQPAVAKRTLVFAYVMTEADLLLEALED